MNNEKNAAYGIRNGTVSGFLLSTIYFILYSLLFTPFIALSHIRG